MSLIRFVILLARYRALLSKYHSHFLGKPEIRQENHGQQCGRFITDSYRLTICTFTWSLMIRRQFYMTLWEWVFAVSSSASLVSIRSSNLRLRDLLSVHLQDKEVFWSTRPGGYQFLKRRQVSNLFLEPLAKTSLASHFSQDIEHPVRDIKQIFTKFAVSYNSQRYQLRCS